MERQFPLISGLRTQEGEGTDSFLFFIGLQSAVLFVAVILAAIWGLIVGVAANRLFDTPERPVWQSASAGVLGALVAVLSSSTIHGLHLFPSLVGLLAMVGLPLLWQVALRLRRKP